MLATDLGKPRANATPIGCGAAPAGGQAGPSGDGARRGAACRSLARPGHGGVGARVVPAAHRTGWAPQRSAHARDAAKAGHSPGAPAWNCENPQSRQTGQGPPHPPRCSLS